MYPQTSNSHIQAQRFIIAGSVILAVILLLGLSVLGGRIGKTPMTIEFAPSLATGELDGKSVKQGTVYLSKGEHTLSVSLDNFTSRSQVFVVGEHRNLVSVSLDPSNPAGQKLLEENPQYQVEREAVGSQEKEGRAAVDQTPLIAQLPVTDISGPYKIDYGQSPSRKNGSVIIISDSSPNGRRKALDWISRQGFDPSDLEIQYADFNNPLTGRP